MDEAPSGRPDEAAVVTDAGRAARPWPLRAVLAGYNTLLPAGLALMLPGSLVKMRRRGGHARDLAQRFGFFGRETSARLAALDKPWWVHAVSVGEVLVAAKIIAALRKRAPGLGVVLSTTTSTGFRVARETLPADVPVIFNPLDLSGCVRRVLDVVQPRGLLLVEAEVWPNLVTAARAWGLPVVLANARLSPRSERRYRSLHRVVAPVFGLLDHVFVPEPADVARWTAIGVRPDALSVAGSVKHDYEAAPGPATDVFAGIIDRLWAAPRPPLLLAASTHAGEEAALATVYRQLREKHPALRLMVAPRHFERAGEVLQALRSLGLAPTLRSADDGRRTDAAADVLVIDSTGELRGWQALADVVVIGKSFLATGGQNPVEALMAGRPVVCGPHMENFAPLMATLLQHQAVLQVDGLDSLLPAIDRLLSQPAAGLALSDRARAALQPHQGAAGRTADFLLSISHT